MAVSSGPATIASRNRQRTIIIAACVNTLPYSLVAAKGITRWDQIKGENRHQPLRFGNGHRDPIVLKRFGLDPVKDVTIVQLGTQPSRVQALAGAIDRLISPPLDITAKKQGYQILVNIADLKIPYPQQVIETTDRFIRDNPHTAKNFLKGFIEGVRYATSSKEETKKVIIKYLKTTDPEILEATYQSFVQVTDESCYPNMEGIRNAMDEVAQRVSAVKSKARRLRQHALSKGAERKASLSRSRND